MGTVWPLLRAGLLEILPQLPGWEEVDVIDGPPTTHDTGQNSDGSWAYCTVGYVEDERGAGSGTQRPSNDGFFDEEEGEVRSELYTGNGDGDLTQAVTDGFTLVDSLKAAIAADRTLGVLPQASTCSLAFEVVTGRTEGAGQLLVLSVTYTAPIT